MRDAADIERDMSCAVEALDRAVEFLARYDRLQAALMSSTNGGTRSPLTDCAEVGLEAARRVLGELRKAAPAPAFAQRGGFGHGDPGE
jgi:hypothetical protein